MDLRNVDKQRLTSLAWAAIELNVEVFEWLLLDYGHDDQELSRDAEHNTIFHLLAGAAAPPSLSPITRLSSPLFPPRPSTLTEPEKVDIVLRMTDVYYTLFPFLLDWSNSSGKTALHYAAQANNYEFIALLCDLGADVDLADLMGNTPLHYASAWGHVSCCQVLLERGAAVSIRNVDGFTPPDFAYTYSTKSAMDSISKEVVEERRRRREESKRERALSESETSWQGDNGYGEPLPPDIIAAAAAANQARSERRGSRSTFAEGQQSRFDGQALGTAVEGVPTVSLVAPTPKNSGGAGGLNGVSGLGLGVAPSPSPSPSPRSTSRNGSGAGLPAASAPRPPSRSPSMPGPQYPPVATGMRRAESMQTHAL